MCVCVCVCVCLCLLIRIGSRLTPLHLLFCMLWPVSRILLGMLLKSPSWKHILEEPLYGRIAGSMDQPTRVSIPIFLPMLGRVVRILWDQHELSCRMFFSSL